MKAVAQEEKLFSIKYAQWSLHISKLLKLMNISFEDETKKHLTFIALDT